MYIDPMRFMWECGKVRTAGREVRIGWTSLYMGDDELSQRRRACDGGGGSRTGEIGRL